MDLEVAIWSHAQQDALQEKYGKTILLAAGKKMVFTNHPETGEITVTIFLSYFQQPNSMPAFS